MDPYLENPIWWRDLHNRLMTYIADALNAVLPPDYYAQMDERLYVSELDHRIFPDVAVLGIRNAGKPSEGHSERSSVQSAVLDPPLRIVIETEEEREVFIEVRRQIGQTSRVVTAIEVLSPSNKGSGIGRDEYIRKHREIIDSQANLLEIDLLRAGKSPLAPPTEQLLRVAPYDYAISLHRGNDGMAFNVWLLTVRQALPRTVLVPLDGGHDDVLLNLQEVFDRCYDVGRYPLKVDYAGPPIPPLSRADADWADTLLREAGRRP